MNEKHHFSDVDRSRCPVCGFRHDLPPVSVLDLTYCPQCGVPCFAAAGSLRELDVMKCVSCRARFKPRDGGGVRIDQNKSVVLRPVGFFEGLCLVRPSREAATV